MPMTDRLHNCPTAKLGRVVQVAQMHCPTTTLYRGVGWGGAGFCGAVEVGQKRCLERRREHVQKFAEPCDPIGFRWTTGLQPLGQC